MNTFAMYKVLLAQQWKNQRVELTALAIAAAVTCPVSVWMGTTLGGEYSPWELVNSGGRIGVAGMWTALFTGLLCAIRPYLLDARVRHTYALSLPVPRRSYSLFRVSGGLTLVLVPAAAFLIGALIASQVNPSGGLLHTYPMQLTLRFILAAAFAFALGFGAQYGLGRRAVRWLIIATLTVIGVEVVGQVTLHVSMTEPFWSLLTHAGSPFRVFISAWTLFNV